MGCQFCLWVHFARILNQPHGGCPPSAGITDKDALAAIIRITGGNFRLLRRLLSQVERILRINSASEVTAAAVEAARESPVIGTA